MKKRDTKGSEQHISKVPKEHRMNEISKEHHTNEGQKVYFQNLLYPFPLVFKTELIITCT